MTDGSYSEGSAVSGAVIAYKNWSDTVHSGRMTGTGTVASKWGANGLFSHPTAHCPYFNAATACTYWHRS